MNDRPKPLAWWEWLLFAACALAFVGAIVGALGCAAVPTEPTPDEPTGGLVYVLGWPADANGQPDTTGWPWWGKAAAGLAVAIVAPRTRRNLVGAAVALRSGDPVRAAVHLAAVTPFVGSPTEALPETQRKVITGKPDRSDP